MRKVKRKKITPRLCSLGTTVWEQEKHLSNTKHIHDKATGEVNPAQQAAIWSHSHWSGAGQTRLTGWRIKANEGEWSREGQFPVCILCSCLSCCSCSPLDRLISVTWLVFELVSWSIKEPAELQFRKRGWGVLSLQLQSSGPRAIVYLSMCWFLYL